MVFFLHWQSSLFIRIYPPSTCEDVCECFLSHNFSLWANGCNSCLSEVTRRLRLSTQSQAGLGRTCGCSCFEWKHGYTCLTPCPTPALLLTHWLSDLKISLQIHLAGRKVLALFSRMRNKLWVYQGSTDQWQIQPCSFCIISRTGQSLAFSPFWHIRVLGWKSDRDPDHDITHRKWSQDLGLVAKINTTSQAHPATNH